MTARRAIPASLFQQIAQIKVADDPQVELSIDLSLFSFMACGMPFVDIAYLTRQNIRGNELVYHRHKTGRMIRLEITSSMLQLIRKYADRQRATGSSYLFPILPPGNPDHLRYKRSLARHNARLKRIGQTLRLPNPFTSYVVRHSWASEALRCDMPMALINKSVGALVGENDSFLYGRIGYITFGSCEHEGDRLCKSDFREKDGWFVNLFME